MVAPHPSLKSGFTGTEGVPNSGVKEERGAGQTPRGKSPRGGKKNMVQRKQVVVAGKVFDLGEYLPEHVPNRNPDQTVSWALSEYRDIAKGLGHASGTVDWFDLSARHFLEIIGNIPIHEVTPLVMVHFAAGLKERPRWEGHPFAKAGGELAPTSVRNYCKGVKTMFSVLARVGSIPENPLATYQPPTAPEKLPTTWKPDQVRKCRPSAIMGHK